MKKNLITLMISLSAIGIFTMACGSTGSEPDTDDGGGVTLSTTCETTYVLTTLGDNNNGYQKLCQPEAGTGKFYRLEGMDIPANNKYFYVVLGDDNSGRAGTHSVPGDITADGLFLLTIGASSGATPAGGPTTAFKFHGDSAISSGVSTTFYWPLYTSYTCDHANAGYPGNCGTGGNAGPDDLYGAHDVCFEITDTVPPQVTFWATGKKSDGTTHGVTDDVSVDCKNTSTLTRTNALWSKVDWKGVRPLASGTAYIKSNGTNTTVAKVTKIFVSSQSVIGATDVASLTPGSGFSQVGASLTATRHIRLEGLQTPAGTHAAVAFFAGVSAQPVSATATTASGEASFTFYGGGNPAPPAQTSVAYSGQSGTLGTDFGENFNTFTSSAKEVCFDIANTTPPRITLWATGENGADCKSRTTLTADNSILNKNDWTESVALNAAKNYIYLGSGVTTSKVTVYNTIFGSGF